MTARVTCAHPEQNVQECMALMTDKRIRHLPILKDNVVVGMISIGDLVKAIIARTTVYDRATRTVYQRIVAIRRFDR